MKTKLYCRSTFHGRMSANVIARNGQINPRQLKKLRRELCGMDDCRCAAPFQHTEITTSNGFHYFLSQVTPEGFCITVAR